MGTGKAVDQSPRDDAFPPRRQIAAGVMAKDIILHCIGEIGFDGATYRALQFDGSGVGRLEHR